MGVAPTAAAAAAANAAWCNAMSRAHGAETTFDELAWTSASRTPLHYPDAVTLAEPVPASDLLARVDDSEGCSVKDSFASIDLHPAGFRILFEAEWIGLTPPEPDAPPAGWVVVQDAEMLAQWEQAKAGDEPASLFLPSLLSREDVLVLAGHRHGRLVTGAVLNRTGDVAGLSCFFAPAATGAQDWDECLAFAATVLPGTPLLGYASGGALKAAVRSGFQPIGSLRVWARG